MLIAPTFFEVPGAENHYKANRFARRATVAEVSCQGGPHFFALSLHASPAAGDIGKHKPWFHAGVDRWLTSTELPWVFGIDANTPATDPADEDDIDWCWPATDTRPGEDQLLGGLRRHRGRDLWRSHLAARPELMEPILAERPNGPLAISYVLPSGPVRYDHLWATPEFKLRSLKYLEDVTASDHRPVLAELELRPIGT
jgi:hypothetical protein